MRQSFDHWDWRNIAYENPSEGATYCKTKQVPAFLCNGRVYSSRRRCLYVPWTYRGLMTFNRLPYVRAGVKPPLFLASTKISSEHNLPVWLLRPTMGQKIQGAVSNALRGKGSSHTEANSAACTNSRENGTV